jgi:hypothetical protein
LFPREVNKEEKRNSVTRHTLRWSAVAKATENEALWLEGQKLFPNWPGFVPSRRSIELRERCLELVGKAAENLEKLFDP